MFADHSPEFIRFANRYGKTFTTDRAGFDALIAPSIFFCGQVVSRLPFRLPPDVPPPLLEYTFIEVKDFPQGVVGKEGDINCAALYHTYSLCLLEFYGIIASNPAVLSFIGDPSLETSRPFYLGLNPIGFQHWADEFPRLTHWKELIPAFLPRSEIRRELAFYMMHVALRFLWFHELAHILDGHIEYLKSHKGYADIYCHMFEARDEFVEESERRGLELVADVVGCQLLLKGIFDHEDDYMPAAIKSCELTERLLINLTAVMGLCWFWSARDAQVAAEKGLKGSLFDWSSHPSAIGRLTRIIANLRRTTERRTDLADQSLDKAFKKLGGESEAFAHMDRSMDYLRVVQAHDTADAAFTAPFVPPKVMFTHMTEILKRYSYIYRFGPSDLSAADH